MLLGRFMVNVQDMAYTNKERIKRMFEINEMEERFEIKEYYSFNDEIADKVLAYQELIREESEKEENEEYKKKMLEFADYELDHQDKVQILRYIKNAYDNTGDMNDSLIEFAIQDFVNDVFDISPLF